MRKVLSVGSLAALLWITGCGGSSSSNGGGGGGSGNVAPIVVNGGPTGNYANGVFASVTVCVPNTANCSTVNNVLVDTGSSGFRVLASKLNLSGLPQQTSGGNALWECAQFADGFVWGPVKGADVKIAGESAGNIPVQVIDDSGAPAFSATGNCPTGLTDESSLSKLLANGILGVGLARQDCGACASSSQHFYFACASGSCNEIVPMPVAQQVQNPVWHFATDNNGVLVKLPALNSAAPSVNGSLIFGIGTQSNNGLGNATLLEVDTHGNITTTSFGNSFSGFLDTGSNGIFFLDSATTGITQCTGNTSDFYCPASTTQVSATNHGQNGTSASGNFSIANANTLFSTAANNAFSQLGGPNPSTFDFGLPFFFGKNVFVSIEGQPTPANLNLPYFAY